MWSPLITPAGCDLWHIQGLADFFWKGTEGNVLGFVGHMVSVAAAPIYWFSESTRTICKLMGAPMLQQNFI